MHDNARCEHKMKKNSFIRSEFRESLSIRVSISSSKMEQERVARDIALFSTAVGMHTRLPFCDAVLARSLAYSSSIHVRTRATTRRDTHVRKNAHSDTYGGRARARGPRFYK